MKNYITDCHCDSILNVIRDDESIINAYNTSKKCNHLQLFAMWTEFPEGELAPGMDTKYNLDKHDFYGLLKTFIRETKKSIEKNNDFRLCTTYNEVEKAISDNKSIGIISMEGADAVDSLEKLHEIYDMGMRFTTLTWNHQNCLGSGSSTTGTPEDKGLTAYGKDFVKECEALGIALDVSHASDKTLEGILSLTTKPVFASHSNFRAICNHSRNLTDEYAEEIVRRGGFIGLNLYRYFVKENLESADFHDSLMFKHIDYALEKGWAGNLGFGFDIDGIEKEDYPYNMTLETSVHDQFVEHLLEKYDEELVDGIKSGNFLKYIAKVF